jgi:hypothetical protein
MATGNTISGNADMTATVEGQVRARDNSTGFTVKNLNIKPSPDESNACGFTGVASGILTGQNEGTVTISHVNINGCGFNGGGQDHNLYVSAKVGGDNAGNVQIDHVDSIDVVGGGWSFKLRPGGQTVANIVTQVRAYCDQSAASGCDQNGVMNMPCGGNYNVSHFVFERGPQVGDAANWYMVRYGDEIQNAPGGCSNTGVPEFATNTVIFDTGWFIWDGNCTGAASSGIATLICAGKATCVVPGLTPSITVKNSKIVSDPSGCNFNNSLGPGVTDGGGNTFFVSREAAGIGAFPDLPPIP